MKAVLITIALLLGLGLVANAEPERTGLEAAGEVLEEGYELFGEILVRAATYTALEGEG